MVNLLWAVTREVDKELIDQARRFVNATWRKTGVPATDISPYTWMILGLVVFGGLFILAIWWRNNSRAEFSHKSVKISEQKTQKKRRAFKPVYLSEDIVLPAPKGESFPPEEETFENEITNKFR